MDALVRPLGQPAPARCRIAAFGRGGSGPDIDPSVNWSGDERALYDTAATALVVTDLRLLSDLTLVVLSARPTLFVINDPRDLPHYRLLLQRRELVLTPADAVHVTGAARGAPLPAGLGEHLVDDPSAWVAAGGTARSLKGPLKAFGLVGKSRLTELAQRANGLALPSVQHFWRLIGENGSLAQLAMRTAAMERVGAGGPLDRFSPTLLFLDPAHCEDLRALPLPQSVTVVAPFTLPRGQPLEFLISQIKDARPEPFHLHRVASLMDVDDVTLGIVYGEFVV
ncbi:MAG: hypothetical protein AAGD34_16055 [Pseudomonadota bacterium]